MNIAETLKHLGNHWELYCLAGDGEYSFDRAKKYSIILKRSVLIQMSI